MSNTICNWKIRKNFWADKALEVFVDSATKVPVLVRHQGSYAAIEDASTGRSSDNTPYIEIVLHSRLINNQACFGKVEVNLVSPRAGRLNVVARNYWQIELLNFEAKNKAMLLEQAKAKTPDAAKKLQSIISSVVNRRKKNKDNNESETVSIPGAWNDNTPAYPFVERRAVPRSL